MPSPVTAEIAMNGSLRREAKRFSLVSFSPFATSIFDATNHRFLLQTRAPGFKLVHDDFEVLCRIGTSARVRNIDHVQQQPCALDVTKKLRAESVPCAGSFDQPGNVSYNVTVLVRRLARRHDAEVRFQSGKGIVGDLGTRRRDARDQRRFSRIGIANQTDVRQQLQLEPVRALFTGTPKLVFARRLVCGCREVLVASSTASAFGDYDALVGMRKIVNALAGFGVVENGADGNFEDYILPFGSGAVRTFAVASALGFVFGIEAEVHECVVALTRFHDDVAAASAVAAGWSAARDKLLPAKGHASIAAVSGFYANFGFVDEYGEKQLSAVGTRLSA